MAEFSLLHWAWLSPVDWPVCGCGAGLSMLECVGTSASYKGKVKTCNHHFGKMASVLAKRGKDQKDNSRRYLRL